MAADYMLERRRDKETPETKCLGLRLFVTPSLSLPMVYCLPMGIVLIGYRGSGKTTVGRLLAERLAKTFIDCDEVIVARHGKSIREIFSAGGEEAFRRLETSVIAELAAKTDHVIAVGGVRCCGRRIGGLSPNISSFIFAAIPACCSGESTMTRRLQIIGRI